MLPFRLARLARALFCPRLHRPVIIDQSPPQLKPDDPAAIMDNLFTFALDEQDLNAGSDFVNNADFKISPAVSEKFTYLIDKRYDLVHSFHGSKEAYDSRVKALQHYIDNNGVEEFRSLSFANMTEYCEFYEKLVMLESISNAIFYQQCQMENARIYPCGRSEPVRSDVWFIAPSDNLSFVKKLQSDHISVLFTMPKKLFKGFKQYKRDYHKRLDLVSGRIVKIIENKVYVNFVDRHAYKLLTFATPDYGIVVDRVNFRYSVLSAINFLSAVKTIKKYGLSMPSMEKLLLNTPDTTQLNTELNTEPTTKNEKIEEAAPVEHRQSLLDVLYERGFDSFDFLSTKEEEENAALINAFRNRHSKFFLPSRTFSAQDLNENFYFEQHFNASQRSAVLTAINNEFSLIQGPPGTGKTFTAAVLVDLLLKFTACRRILVCAPTNIGVDNFIGHLLKAAPNLYVTRLYASSQLPVDFKYANVRQEVGSIQSLPYVQLSPEYKLLSTSYKHKRTDLFDSTDDYNEFAALFEKIRGEVFQPTNLYDHALFNKFYCKCYGKVLQKSQVVCTTLTNSINDRLVGSGVDFDAVIIDEASKSSEPETLTPFVYGLKRAVLIGDHKQLGPMVSDQYVRQASLGTSMYRRLVRNGVPVTMLDEQFRMDPYLASFSSANFYDNKLRTHQGIVSMVDEKSGNVRATNYGTVKGNNLHFYSKIWPVQMPSIFWNVVGEEEADTMSSIRNPQEAETVLKAVRYLVGKGVSQDKVTVLTAYKNQRALVAELLAEEYAGVEVSSIDAFQGRENDIVIISCVRSNRDDEFGFMRCPFRMNVALTRSRYGRMLIGNAELFKNNRLWRKLIRSHSRSNVLVQGEDVESLQRIVMQFDRFSEPKPLHERKKKKKK